MNTNTIAFSTTLQSTAIGAMPAMFSGRPMSVGEPPNPPLKHKEQLGLSYHVYCASGDCEEGDRQTIERAHRNAKANRAWPLLTEFGATEDTETIEDVYEPYLMQEGYLKRTQRGRVVTEHAYRHVGRTPPAEAARPKAKNGSPSMASSLVGYRRAWRLALQSLGTCPLYVTGREHPPKQS